MHEGHLRRILNEYVEYFNRARPHQGINQHVPEPGDTAATAVRVGADVVAFSILGGLHYEYRKVV